MKWIKQNRTIVPGEVIRVELKPGEWIGVNKMPDPDDNRLFVIPNKKLENDTNETGYLYGIATGGFGLDIKSSGNAIFVEYVSCDYETTKNKEGEWETRWEKHWGVEVAE